jgi:glycosyltransferase involved in cell wall biosynthesis
MKISLIIPAYNEEKYIGECLKSAIKNGEKLFEIIVVNNASTDNTEEVVKSFMKYSSNIRIVNEPRKGLTKARQRGLNEAGGDIIAHIDADTKMPRGWVEKVKRNFEKNSNIVCVSGPYIYYDQSFIGKMFVLLGYMAVGGNFAVKKDAVEKIGGFDENISFYGEDTDIARRLSRVGKVKFFLNLYMYTSARRLKNEGVAKTAIKYLINFVSEVFFKKPATGDYKDIR